MDLLEPKPASGFAYHRLTAFAGALPGAFLGEHTVSHLPAASCTRRADRVSVQARSQITFGLALPTRDASLVGALIRPVRAGWPRPVHHQPLEPGNSTSSADEPGVWRLAVGICSGYFSAGRGLFRGVATLEVEGDMRCGLD